MGGGAILQLYPQISWHVAHLASFHHHMQWSGKSESWKALQIRVVRVYRHPRHCWAILWRREENLSSCCGGVTKHEVLGFATLGVHTALSNACESDCTQPRIQLHTKLEFLLLVQRFTEQIKMAFTKMVAITPFARSKWGWMGTNATSSCAPSSLYCWTGNHKKWWRVFGISQNIKWNGFMSLVWLLVGWKSEFKSGRERG